MQLPQVDGTAFSILVLQLWTEGVFFFNLLVAPRYHKPTIDDQPNLYKQMLKTGLIFLIGYEGC